MKQKAFVHRAGPMHGEHPIKQEIIDSGLSISEVWRRMNYGKSLGYFSQKLNGWSEMPEELIVAIRSVIEEHKKSGK